MPILETPHVGRMVSRAWRTPFQTIALRTIVTVVMLAGTAAEAQAPRPPIDSEHTPSGIGMQAGSALATIAYFPFKAVTAIGGSVVGGLGYLFLGRQQVGRERRVGAERVRHLHHHARPPGGT